MAGIKSFSLLVVLLAGILQFGQAWADQVLYDGSGFLAGSTALPPVSFDLHTSGTLSVSLVNNTWPVQLASLTLVLQSTSGALGPQMGVGTENFTVSGSGEIFAQLFGTAQGPLNLGVYSLYISFQPSAGTPVPLPTSITLLISGLLLMALHRRMATATPPRS